MQNKMPLGQEVVGGESSEVLMASTKPTKDRKDAEIASKEVLRSLNGYNETQESMAEPELLALIIELRLRAGETSSKDKDKPKVSSDSKSSALPSAVDTLDLSHLKIEKLPYDMVNIIKDDVIRLALGYNLITSLPSNFIDLSQLRYLNVRANLMNTFPSVLCTMPCLEILDISRNKIRKLPSEPGRLLELKVLSISNNRLRKLPVWLYRAKDLRILKLDGNPISWPPPHISVMPPFDKATTADKDVSSRAVIEKEVGETDEEAAQKARKKAEDRHILSWLTTLKAWVEKNKDKVKGDQEDSRVQAKSPDGGKKVLAESGGIEGETTAMPTQSPKSTVMPLKANVEAEKVKVSILEPQTPGDSKRNIGATFLNIQSEAQSEDERDESDEVIASPVKVHSETLPLGEAKKAIGDLSDEQRSLKENGILTSLPRQASPEQMYKVNEVLPNSDIASSLALQQVTQSVEDVPEASLKAPSLSLHHGRNNSLSTMQTSPSLLATNTGNTASTLRRGIIRNKKSLPDLRQNQGLLTSDRSESGDVVVPSPSGEAAQRRKGSNLARRPPLPQTSSENVVNTLNSRGASGDVWPSNTTEVSDNGASSSGENKSSNSMGLNSVQMAPMEAAAVEVERNSYFRRLSTLPASTISKSISVPILQCVDATRGVLYALSQMHSALKQYITFASDDRMTSQLSRALDIASRSMAGLINSLDRFDSLSRIKGGNLNPIIVRGVLTSCSESIVSFRKIVSLLHLQLKSLQSGADIRYTRTLLLLLYGSLAEVHHSWMVMEPLFKDVLPYLQGHEEKSDTMPSTATIVPNLSVGHPYTLPSIAEASSPISPNNARFGTTQARPLRRRHAGSFSAQDVAQGATMIPSVPLPTHGYEEIRKAQRPTALGPFPTSSRMEMYQVQQGDTDGGDLSDFNQSSPMESLAPKERSIRVPDDNSRRTLSNISGGKVTARTHTAESHKIYPIDTIEAVVDDHLVLLLVKITSIAYSVWASINDHLNSMGVPAVGKGTTKTNGLLNTQYTTPESTPLLDGEGFVASPHTPARVIRAEGSSSSMTVMQDQMEEKLSPEIGTKPLPPQAAHLSFHILSKLRNLRDSTNLIIDQTNKLESCCDKVQEKSGIKSPIMTNNSSNKETSDQTFKDIFMESSSFIKSILNISHFIKSLSIDHQFPKSIKVNLAQLTTCARDLTLHLHYLGASSASQQAPTSATVVSPKSSKD